MLNVKMIDCTGCEGCKSTCPVSAISMQENKEGFLCPSVDNEKCIKCDKCNKVCPVNKDLSVPDAQKYYAAWCKDKNVLQKSSSGGVFNIIAEHVLTNNGFVCGCELDENNVAKHVIINDKKDLDKLRRSKYVQSQIGNCFVDIKSLLKQKLLVLFVGTPCQVDGLNLFLRKKYDNLITIDVVCGGVSSPKVWQKYLAEFGDKVSDYNFRNKNKSWINFNTSYELNQKIYHKNAGANLYYTGFIKKLYSRLCCANCRYTNLNRVADFTLADFWYINKNKKSLYNKNGTSLIITNNKKADELLSMLKNQFEILQEVSASLALKSNKALRKPTKQHCNRAHFFASLESSDFSPLVNKCINSDVSAAINNTIIDNKKIGLMNFQHGNGNFGALMVAYSLSKVLKNNGYKPEIINFIHKTKGTSTDVFERFRETYFNRSIACKSFRDLELVAQGFDYFISGADQVFRYHSHGKYLFNFVYGMKNIISYGASFGKDKYENKDVDFTKTLLERFDAISVREQSGVDILKSTFGLDGTCVLDPTMLLNAQDYQEIIDGDDAITPNEDYVATMFLDGNIKLDFNLKLVDCLKTNGKFHSFGQWLNYIKNCKYFICDSFHGCVFAILFKKQFICIARNEGGNARIENLFNQLNINQNRFVKKAKEINENSFVEQVDYNNVDLRLSEKRALSLKFLMDSLKIPLSYKQKSNVPQDYGYNFLLFGLPILRKKIEGFDVFYKLFNLIPFVVKKITKKGFSYKLFGALNILTVKDSYADTKYKLFGIIPIASLKRIYK